MGGFGSGRDGWRPSLERCQVLDVFELHRQRDLTNAEHMRLSLKVRDVGGEPHDVTQTVYLEHVPCPFGSSSRPFFICPGRSGAWCGRRSVRLYSRGSLFLCRKCHRLAYPSENEDDMARAQRAAGKIKQRLGGSPDVAARLPRKKPKGMWQRTYQRELRRYEQAEARVDDAFEAHASIVLSRVR